MKKQPNTKTQKGTREAVAEFEEYLLPKVFCGSDSCTGLWNLDCDAIEHNDGRELIVKSKAITFLTQKLEHLAKQKDDLKALFTESVLGLEAMQEEEYSHHEDQYKNRIENRIKMQRNQVRAEIKQELLGGKA